MVGALDRQQVNKNEQSWLASSKTPTCAGVLSPLLGQDWRMTPVEAACPHCRTDLRFEQVQTGFNNTGYAYCNLDGILLVWDTFDPKYVEVVGDQHPWTLDGLSRAAVEAKLAACPCGGRFGMANPPRCPTCNEPLRDLLPDRIYFADFGRRLNPALDHLWL
jgi:hypothetical protein